jgi:type I restriction enzyme S subunit
VLRIPNVVGGKINTTDLKFAVLPMTEMAKTELRVGDILFVRTNGNREYTGRCAVYSGTPPTARFASYLIRTGLTQDYEPDFVVGFLNTVGRDQIVSRANPAADGKFNVDTGILKSVMLPHPTREEQIEIMRIIRAIENAEDCARRKSTALSALFTTALNELITGSVRLKAMEVTHA